MIHFTINGAKFESQEAEVTVAWLLELVGLQSADAELARPASGDLWTKPFAHVKLSDGDAFNAKRPGGPPHPAEPEIGYMVNGEPQVAEKTPLTLEEILRRAGGDAAINVDELESYYLDDVRSGVRYENLDDEVPLAEGDRFLALYAGPTPVA